MKTILLFLIISSQVSAFDSNSELPIGLTENEVSRLDEIYSMGRETDPPPSPIRNIAEFERMQGALIRYPFGLSTDIISELSSGVKIYCLVSSSQLSSALSTMENGGVSMDNVEFVIGSTDSYWTRDYGPWWVVDGDDRVSIVDFTYNRPRQNDNDAPLKISNYLDAPYYATEIVHAGGNYMTDGLGVAASSDLVYEENTISEDEINLLMQNYYGIDTYHVVNDPNNTYIDHIDCWGKYLSPTKVLIRQVPNSHPQYDEIEEVAEYFSNSLNDWGEPWELYRVWTPNNQPYTNSFIINEKVFVPVTGGNWDDDALEVYENALPGYEVLGFSGSWESTDALHCRIKGIPDVEMLQVFHNPLDSGTAPEGGEYPIQALIDDLSGAGLIIDSIKVFWRILDAQYWTDQQMFKLDLHDNENFWVGGIPALIDTGNIQYYIQAADSSGRIEKSPLAGWHSFVAIPTSACLTWIIGDVDNNENLNVIDLLLLTDFVNGSVPGLCPESISDINSDGEISIVDIELLVNIVLNQ